MRRSIKVNNNKYILAEACKNTFVIFDAIELQTLSDDFLKMAHDRLIAENRDDAMILVDGRNKDENFYVRMVVLGVDGELGEFCGNGARACAAYLFSNYKEFKNFYIVTPRGEHKLYKYEGGIYSVELPLVTFELNKKFITKPELFENHGNLYSINLCGKNLTYAAAIEPHLVIQEYLNDDELLLIGEKINSMREIFPLGINVNSCYVKKDGTLFVRTYERGVQRLTLSCGTGSSSCSAIYLGNKPGEVNIETLGGPLEVKIKSSSFELKGPAILSD